MKKKKSITLLLSMLFLLPVLTLTACSNLDDVEKNVVGTWTGKNSVYEFTDNKEFTAKTIDDFGTTTTTGGTLSHNGNGTGNGIYHYEIIVLTFENGTQMKLYLFDVSQDTLCSSDSLDKTFLYRK